METNESKADNLQLARLKAASEDYKVHKSIYIDPVTEERLEGFLEWPVFRDQFLTDWKSNRRVVTEKEADVIFDRIADESLSELENIGTPADVSELAEQVAASSESDEDTLSTELEKVNPEAAISAAPIEIPAVVTKRRGRPPGSGKAKLTVVASNDAPVATVAKPKAKSYYVPVSQRKAAKPAKVSKPKLKAAAAKKKKKNKSTSERAAVIVAWGQSRHWTRKDIIERMVTQIEGLGAAYAGTLYQKFAN